MKNIFLLILFSFFFKSADDQILGIWLNEEKNRTIKIYKSDHEYRGIMYWIGKPDPALYEGQVVIKGLKKKNGNYVGGLAFTQNFGWVECDAQIIESTLYITGTKLGVKKVRKFTSWKEK